jgi:hypothetical protein
VKQSKRKELEEAGWAVETVSEFLGLSEEEEMLVLIRSLASLGATQAEIGRIVGQRVESQKPTKASKRRKQPASK